MFRNDAQKCQAIQVLLVPTRLEELWTDKGPTKAACTLLEDRGGPLSHGERLMLFAAFDFWNGDGHTDLGDAVATLDSANLQRLCTLMMAVHTGAGGIDAWIETWRIGSTTVPSRTQAASEFERGARDRDVALEALVRVLLRPDI